MPMAVTVLYLNALRTFMRIKQIEAYHFLISLSEKEDVKKKTEKETVTEVKKKGIVLCFLSQIMFRMFIASKSLGVI